MTGPIAAPARSTLRRVGVDTVSYIRLLRRGIVIAIDSFGMLLHFEPWSPLPTAHDYERWNHTTDDDRIRTLADLIHCGYEDQLLLGQDVSFKVQWKRFGGFGYDHVISRAVPRLQRRYGIDDVVADKLLVQNPRRVLSAMQA